MEMIRTVVFTGPLADKFGERFEFAANSIAEIVSALRVMVPGFEKFLMNSKDNDMDFAVFADEENYGEEQLSNPLGSAKEIKFVPIIGGAKKGGLLQIVAGIVLIVAGYIVTGLSKGLAAPVGNYMIGMGISMIVGGIVQMLSPQPKADQNRKDDPRSYVFNGSVNVQAQGACVPVAYGEVMVGSVVVSAGIIADEGYVIPSYGSGGYSDDSYKGGGSMVGDVIARAKDGTE